MFSSITTFFNTLGLNEAEIKFFDAARCNDIATISDFFNNLIPFKLTPYYKTKIDQMRRNMKAIEIALSNGHQKAAIAIIDKDLITSATLRPSEFRELFYKSLNNDFDELFNFLVLKKLVNPKDRLPICFSLAHLDPEKYNWGYGDMQYRHSNDDLSRGYQNPLYLACASGSEKVVKLLLNIKPSIVSIEDGKFGYYSTDGSGGESTGDFNEYDIRAVEAAQEYPNISQLLSQHFTPAHINAAIRVKPASSGLGCTIC